MLIDPRPADESMTVIWFAGVRMSVISDGHGRHVIQMAMKRVKFDKQAVEIRIWKAEIKWVANTNTNSVSG